MIRSFKCSQNFATKTYYSGKHITSKFNKTNDKTKEHQNDIVHVKCPYSQ